MQTEKEKVFQLFTDSQHNPKLNTTKYQLNLTSQGSSLRKKERFYSEKEQSQTHRKQAQNQREQPQTQKKYNFQLNFLQRDVTQTSNKQIFYQQKNQTRPFKNQVTELLKKLNQTEEALVKAEKKYGELWKKYQISCEETKTLKKQINVSEQKRLQGLLFLQKNLHLMEQEALGRDKQSMRNRQLLSLQSQVEDLLEQTGNKHRRIQQLECSLQSLKRQSQVDKKSLIRNCSQWGKKQSSLIEQIQILKRQLVHRQSLIEAKNLQLSTLVMSLEKLRESEKVSAQKNRQETIRIRQLYEECLEEAKMEKGKLLEHYEEQLCRYQEELLNRKIKTNTLNNAASDGPDQEQPSKKFHQRVKTEEQILKLRVQNRKLLERHEHFEKQNCRLESECKLLHQRISTEYIYQIQQLRNNLASTSQKILKLQTTKTQENSRLSEILFQFNRLKLDFTRLFQEKQALQSKNQTLTKQLSEMKLLTERLRQQQNIHLSQGIKQNKQVSSKVNKLQEQLKQRDQQLEIVTRDLLAQRLESATLKQQMQEQQKLLKAQYSISLEKVRQELSQKISQVKRQSQLQKGEKEKVYLKLKALQKNYELLASQTLTVEEMMGIATKVHKRHSKYYKNT